MAKRIKVKGKTAPSSTRKKRVKEGSRKFVGPRTADSENKEFSKWEDVNHPNAEDLGFVDSRGRPTRKAGRPSGPGSRYYMRSVDEEDEGSDLKSLIRNYLIKTGKIKPF
jgi:hypothetical protein